MDPEKIRRAEALLGHEFEDKQILIRALTHASLADSRLQSNERLEFLGDAILGMVVCEYLFDRYQDRLEGDLTKIKSSVVSRRTCANIARELGLDELLRIGKGMADRAELPRSVLAAVFEALVGALHLDGGLKVSRRFILDGMLPTIERAAGSDHQFNFKSVLQQAAQDALGHAPQYVVLDEKGPDHAKCFEICVEIGARRFKSAWGASKKQAEQQAALEALFELELAQRDKTGDVRMTGRGEELERSPLEEALED
jgi:ribonuclease-3